MFKRALLAFATLVPLCAIVLPARAQICAAPASWFPEIPESANQEPMTFCAFYLWSWQTFLFTMQADPASGDKRPRLLTYDTPADLFGPRVALAFPSASRLAGGAQTLLRLAPRVEKQPGPTNVSDILQAGSRGVVVDQNGRPILYQVHLNGAFSKFVRDHGFSDLDKLKNAKADLEFPTGVVELKSSWRVLRQNETAKGLFTTRAMVPRLINIADKDGKSLIATDPNQATEETVALLGLHVVGVVAGHPEFIWATFEHVDNAPDLPNGLDPHGTAPVDNSRNWTLYAKGTPAASSNKKTVPPQLRLDEAKQVLAPVTHVFRESAFGGSPHANLITGLTNSVHQQLPPELDVWKHYFLVGALWLRNPAQDFKPDMEFSDLNRLEGAKLLSNSTMETFTQRESARPHCFRCHDTRAAHIPGGNDTIQAKLLNVSHVFVKAHSNLQQLAPTGQ
jgi:hypothetical protein